MSANQPAPPAPETKEKAICRRCAGLFVAITHDFDECERQQADMAMLRHKQRGGHFQDSVDSAMRLQLNQAEVV